MVDTMILSLQFTLTVIICFLYIKLTPYYSIAHKWFSGLEFCIPPEEKELDKLDNNAIVKRRRKKGFEFLGKKNEIELRVVSIDDNTLNKHLFWEEYDTLVLVLIAVVINYFFSEFWSCFISEKNTIMTALLLFSTGVCVKILTSVIVTLGLHSHESRIIIFVAVIAFINAMFVVQAPEWLFNFSEDLRIGYVESLKNINEFLEKNEISFRLFLDFEIFKWILCGGCAMMASIMFFPAFRLARSHYEILKYTPKPYHPKLSIISFWMPGLVFFMWVNPFFKNIVVVESPGAPAFFKISENTFEGMRFLVLGTLCILRLLLVRPYIQAFLATSVGWAELLLGETKLKERGKNIKFKILGIYSYLCVAAVQILAPTLLLISLLLLWKTRGLVDLEILPFCSTFTNANATKGSNTFFDIYATVLFTPTFYRGVFSFLCFWHVMSWFVISLFALLYERNQSIFLKRELPKIQQNDINTSGTTPT